VGHGLGLIPAEQQRHQKGPDALRLTQGGAHVDQDVGEARPGEHRPHRWGELVMVWRKIVRLAAALVACGGLGATALGASEHGICTG